MKFIADLHIHSKYSRATSPDMTPENIDHWAQLKGIDLMGTGDFTHPQWLGELQEKLVKAENGLYRLKPEYARDVPSICKAAVYFVPTAEISCIYRKGEKTRKVHLLVLLPSFEDVSSFNMTLARRGNLASDGRPILGLDAKELLAMVLDTSPQGLLIPAHAWTPHFAVFGAFSGFDRLEDCFEDLTPQVYAIETGLSSDPSMNRRLSALDDITLLSNSDAHSLPKIGREANIFETELTYENIIGSIKTGNGFNGTVEFFSQEGKYYFDGHRPCGVFMPPEETLRHNSKCPVCGKKITVGVLHRVSLLADRKKNIKSRKARPYHSLIPFQEIVSESLGVGVQSKKVQGLYHKTIEMLGPEYFILMKAPLDEIQKVAGEKIGQGIRIMREGKVNIRPGYDGEFGRIKLFERL